MIRTSRVSTEVILYHAVYHYNLLNFLDKENFSSKKHSFRRSQLCYSKNIRKLSILGYSYRQVFLLQT